MISKQPIESISKLQFIIQCLTPYNHYLPAKSLLPFFILTEAIKLHWRLKQFISNNGVLVQSKPFAPHDNWIKNWKIHPKTLYYREILAEIIHILRPIVYLILLLFQDKRSYRAYAAFIALDLLRMGLQKPAQNQVERFEYSRRVHNTISKLLFSSPLYNIILKPRLLFPLLSKLFPNSPNIHRIAMYIAEIKAQSTLTI